MTRHIDQKRIELLVRRDALMLLPEPRTDEVWQKLDEYNEALAKLDEVAGLGDTRTYPRLKVRRILEYVRGTEVPEGRQWIVTQQLTPEDESERVLGFLPDQGTAFAAAEQYIEVQRFLADRLAYPNGAGL